jgi:hypothetical protein
MCELMYYTSSHKGSPFSYKNPILTIEGMAHPSGMAAVEHKGVLS